MIVKKHQGQIIDECCQSYRPVGHRCQRGSAHPALLLLGELGPYFYEAQNAPPWPAGVGAVPSTVSVLKKPLLDLRRVEAIRQEPSGGGLSGGIPRAEPVGEGNPRPRQPGAGCQ